MLAFPTLSLPLGELCDLLRPVEPTASVYLGPPIDVLGDPEWEPVLRRRRIAGHLAEQGAPNLTIDAIVGHLARHPSVSTDYAVFARDGRVVLAQHVPGVAVGISAYTAPALVGPLLASHQREAKVEPWDGFDVSDVRATVEALAAGRVRRLLLVDDPDDRRTAWFAADLLCATDDTIPADRARYAQRGRLVDVAIRAAILGGANVTVLTAAEGSGLPGGLAAILTQ